MAFTIDMSGVKQLEFSPDQYSRGTVVPSDGGPYETGSSAHIESDHQL
jgi:hypothetical protein